MVVGFVSSLRQVTRQMGFRWKQTKNNRKLLITEKHDITKLRVDYIRKIQQYREGQYCVPIVYTDKTYFHISMLITKTSTDNDESGMKTSNK